MASVKARAHSLEQSMCCMRILFTVLCVSIAATLLTECEARVSKQSIRRTRTHPPKYVSSPSIAISRNTDHKIKDLKHIEMNDDPDPVLSNTQPYVGSPFTLPPFDSLPPIPLPQNTSPECEYTPSNPTPPPFAAVVPTPTTYTTPPPPPSPSIDVPSPPDSSIIPSPPEYGPIPPSLTPGTPEYVPSPPSPPSFVPGTPDYDVPAPPETVPGTPTYFPSPSGYTPSPTVFQPPVVYPPPSVPPPPYKAPHFARWCVAKPSVPDPIIEEAMNYACGSGADCGSIQPNGSCYHPDTLFDHASYAFNSYWQRTKAAGGTCDFGGTGMLITVDPSFDGCRFIYY